MRNHFLQPEPAEKWSFPFPGKAPDYFPMAARPLFGRVFAVIEHNGSALVNPKCQIVRSKFFASSFCMILVVFLFFLVRWLLKELQLQLRWSTVAPRMCLQDKWGNQTPTCHGQWSSPASRPWIFFFFGLKNLEHIWLYKFFNSQNVVQKLLSILIPEEVATSKC